MIEKVFKVGDTITIKRTSQAGTGYRYALVRLTGGVALVEELSEGGYFGESEPDNRGLGRIQTVDGSGERDIPYLHDIEGCGLYSASGCQAIGKRI